MIFDSPFDLEAESLSGQGEILTSVESSIALSLLSPWVSGMAAVVVLVIFLTYTLQHW